ncbi:glycosyltransferase family 4 protein [Zoogloea sp.]|uniref:MraY family glycosyltransferase n=1 Tax=Zoogloea sp. TaxID=49181 RepID=UPI0035AE250E
MAADAVLLAAPLLAFGVAWAVTWLCCRPGSWLHFLDHPNERSLHVKPIPRTGGVGVMAGALAGGLVAVLGAGAGRGLVAALGGGLALAVVGLLDDRRSLSARRRLVAQLLAAAVFLALLAPAGGWAFAALCLLGLTWMANLYNFMDGADGLAGGMALAGFACLAWVALAAGQPALAAACAGIAAAAAGFLCFNFHPARIFMGDSGSVPLGFMAGALGLAGREAGAWPLWFPLLVFSPFVMDATVTLLRRALRGEKIWQAHRTHYYQRLVQMGLGHRGTALAAYALMAAVGGTAVAGLPLGFSLQCAMITMWAFIYLVLGWAIDRAWRRFEAAKAPLP